jgi:Na+-transporting methylmalonyl-CoA/oxaloacetate decarboxylase gamma subunit
MNLHFILMDAAMDFGFTVAIVGFGIVLGSLLLLFVLFSRIPKLINMKLKRRKGQKERMKKPLMRISLWKETLRLPSALRCTVILMSCMMKKATL